MKGGTKMSCRQRLEQLFAEKRVPFKLTSHPTAYTAQEIANTEHISGYDFAKVVIAMVDDKLAMLVLPAPHRVDLELLRSGVKARTARLATEPEFTQAFEDCETGAMPPFGNLFGVPVYADPSLRAHPEITFNAGSHRETMTIAYADFERVAQPQVLPLSHSPKVP